MTVVIEE